MTTESQQHINNETNEISLKDLILRIREWWRYLLSKWMIILAFGLLGGALGFFYATTKKPIYTATTTFVLEDEKLGGGGLGSLAGLASMAGVDVGSGGGIFQGDNIFELYKSRRMVVQTLLTEVIDNGRKETLIDRYLYFNDFKNKWKDKVELAELSFKPDTLLNGNLSLKPNRLRDSILNSIVSEINKNCLTVEKSDKKLSILKVDVKSKDEFFSKAFNEAIVGNVNEFYLQTKTKKSLQNVQIMQQKADSVRAVMNGAIYEAVAIADATPNLNPTRQVQRVAPAQRAQFSAETNKAILSSLVQNLEMSKLALMKDTPLLEIIDKPIYPLDKQNFGKIKGIGLGGFLFGFLAVFFLTTRRALRSVFYL
ncbi:Wzz/FepE/Etk N-terminal domain-containing protein [Pedobacter namyangjuensis]|uniref:Wzz/FepE/Etk N-terminal domain-containing protein n=1 Tax=Pedobacter namyangjuensis TaxID=600626 RepID=UPI000DE26B18|nr:Wzz/FepE/Etk N-terminal domain-containing protein [Pedobacter namyangjuensis]